MLNLEFVRREIEHMRVQVQRQGKEILQLQSAGLSAASVEVLLGRMKVKIWGLIEQRERLKKDEPGPAACFGDAIGKMTVLRYSPTIEQN